MSEQMAWIDPSSTTTLLDGSGNYLALMGRQGILAAPQSFIEQDIPLAPGARLLQVKTQVNEPLVPVLISAASDSALAVAYRALRAAMNPLRGIGTLQYTAADSTVRQLKCSLESGLEGDESIGKRSVGWIMAPLQFRAQDPFWYDTSATTVSKTSANWSSFSINNTGDAECWPVYTITGPGTNPVLTDTTTGLAMTFTIVLGGSDVLTIDTTPNVNTILLNGTTNEYSAISVGSALFSLIMGPNALTFAMSSSSGASGLSIAYKQRYLGV